MTDVSSFHDLNLRRPPIKQGKPPQEDDDTTDMSSGEEEDEAMDTNENESRKRQKLLYPELGSEDGIKSTKLPSRNNVPSTHKTDDKVTAGFQLNVWWCVIICAMTILFTFMVFYFMAPDQPHTQVEGNTVKKIVSNLKKSFKKQPTLSLKVIEKALNKILISQNMSQPTAPAILLLMSSKGAENIASCFAEQLATLISSDEGEYQTILGTLYHGQDPAASKKKIDQLIIQAVESKQQKVVFIKNLDLIPPKAAMILHRYCDHESAPYKDVVFIMTIDSNADIPDDSDSKLFDELAETRLTSVWGQELLEDTLSALLSRITVTVAAVLSETKSEIC